MGRTMVVLHFRLRRGALGAILIGMVGCSESGGTGKDVEHDARASDMASDDGSALDAGPSADADPAPDAGLREDVGPNDGAPQDSGPPDAYLGLFDERPPTPCTGEVTRLATDQTLGFEQLAEVPPGYLFFAGDADGNGRAELYVNDGYVDPVLGEQNYNLVSSILELDEAWQSRGRVRSFRTKGFGDLDGDGRAELLGFDNFDMNDGDRGSGRAAVVRANRVEDEWMYDGVMASLVHVNGLGVRYTQVGPVIFTQLLDADGDDAIDFLAASPAILHEWDGETLREVYKNEDSLRPGGEPHGAVTFGDYDGNGRPELILPGNHDEDGPLYTHFRVVESTGDDAYALKYRLTAGVHAGVVASTGDVEGDDRPEFLVGGDYGLCMRYELWRAGAQRPYERVWRLDTAFGFDYPHQQTGTAFGDTDGDGDDELLIGMERTVALFEWDGVAYQQIFGVRCEDCAWTPVWLDDVDGDGRAELIFHQQHGAFVRFPPTPDVIQVYRRLP